MTQSNPVYEAFIALDKHLKEINSTKTLRTLIDDYVSVMCERTRQATILELQSLTAEAGQ